jgi:osmotically-inducible protein OsmY
MIIKEETGMGLAQCRHKWVGVLCTLIALLLVSKPSVWAQRSVGEVIDDAVITTQVKASFASELERQRAIQLAQGTEGVKQVNAQNLRLRR